MRKFISSIVVMALFALSAFSSSSFADGNQPFKDVGDTFWAQAEINSMAELGFVKGYDDNTFKPNKSVSREEFAVFITRAFFLDLPDKSQPQTFADVSTSRWSYTSIEAAKEFLTGYYPPSGKAFFSPTANATREDVAVALVKTMGLQPDELKDQRVLDRFYDGDNISPNVRTYVALAVEHKLISGYSDGSFKPERPVTRAEASTLLYRVIKGASGDSQQTLKLNVDAPEKVSSPTFYISGDVTKGAKVFINNEEVDVVQGAFRVGFRLEEEGVYKYTISARLAGGKTQTVTKSVKFEKGAPSLEVKGVPESTDKGTITVSWTAKDENDYSVTVYLNGERTYSSSASVTLTEGDNVITVTAENSQGKKTEVVKHVMFKSDGPVLNVLNIPAATDKDTITVNWTVQDKNDSSPKVFLNGERMYGSSASVKLSEGVNKLNFRAVNSLGKSTEVTKEILFNVGVPVLTVGYIPETTDKNAVTVTWSVTDKNDNYPKVYINDQQAYGSSTSISLSEGVNTITFKAVNNLGKTTIVTKTITLTTGAPVLKISDIPQTTERQSVAFTVSATDKNDNYPKVYVNDSQVYGSSVTLNLIQGVNTIRIKAINSQGKTTEETRTIVFEPTGPRLTLGYAPETTSSESITLTWNVSDTNDSYPKVYVNDKLVSYGSSMDVKLKPGANTFKIVASNSYGKTTQVTYTVVYTPAT